MFSNWVQYKKLSFNQKITNINHNYSATHTKWNNINNNLFLSFELQVTHCCVVWCVLVCWMNNTWNSITFWVWKSKISWNVVFKHKFSNLDWPNQSIMHVYWSVKDIFGKYHIIWTCKTVKTKWNSIRPLMHNWQSDLSLSCLSV